MTRHQVETELSDIRREITRLQRREAMLLTSADPDAVPLPRPGWPMLRAGLLTQTSGSMSSSSSPSLIAV